MDAETPVTGTLQVRDNAVVDYTPTAFGLAPISTTCNTSGRMFSSKTICNTPDISG